MATTRIVLSPDGDPRPSLMVHVVGRVDDVALTRLRRDMHRSSCAHGLAIDPERVHILRDTFRDMTEASIVEEPEHIETARLVGGGITSNLGDAIVVWLSRLANRWDETLPREAWVAPLLTDVVSAASGSVVRRSEAA